MNARTSRLLRRLAFVVAKVEAHTAAVQHRLHPEKAPQRVPTAAMQLASLKQAWLRTPRPQRGAQRVRCVGIFNAIVNGAPQ